MKKLPLLPVLFLSGILLMVINSDAQRIVRVYPKVIDSVLYNPGIGFMTFQRFNGDTLNRAGWTEGFPIVYQPFHGNFKNKNYPETTIAYFRIYWRYIEPESGKYNWGLIDKALRTASERHQTLMLRVAPYGYPLNEETDVPAWYRSMVGYKDKVNLLSKRWRVDPEDPRYLKYFGGLIAAMGKRYDGNPHLLSVDLSIVGFWGEGAGSRLLTQRTRKALIDAYTDNFKKTPLIMQLTDRKTSQYGLSQANVGWRGDCLGNMGGLTSGSSSEMLDEYPEDLVECGMQDAWEKAPVSMEVCGTMRDWKKRGFDINYIINQSLKWHISSFNAKSSPVPEQWKPEVERWLKKMGYRLALRRFTYPDSLGTNSILHFASWWENQGDAPCYNKSFRLALRLVNTRGISKVFVTNADITEWLPGDNIYNNSIYISFEMPAGDYELQVGIVDRQTHKPTVNLAIEGRDAKGWYNLGKINIVK